MKTSALCKIMLFSTERGFLHNVRQLGIVLQTNSGCHFCQKLIFLLYATVAATK